MSILKQLKIISSNISILYVEDDKTLLESLSAYLRLIFVHVDTAEDGKSGLEKFHKNKYDIIITDIQMPNMNGLKMIEAIREKDPDQEILITTAFSEVSYLMKAIELEVNGYIIKPINFDKINTTLYKVVSRINMLRENERYKTKLEEMVEQRTAQNLVLQREKIDNYEKTLLSLVELVEKRDTYTGGHSLRVAKYSKLIAEHMNYSKEECDLIYSAGILHDIGKIETPDAVLLNPGKLDELQFSIIKEHVITGTKMLSKIPMYKEHSKIIAQHHERYDGTGYPNGLKEDEIIPLARIMIISDAFDAMTTNRIYKTKMSLASALEELDRFSGIQFHPEVVKVAIEVFKELTLDENIVQLPETEMEKKKFAFYFEDQITNTYNKTYLDLFLIQNKNTKKAKFINVLFIHNYGVYSDKYGWDKGDLLLKAVANLLCRHYKDSFIFRLHGDDFVIVTNKKISIDLSIFKDLLSESNDLILLENKELNIKKEHIGSLLELEKLLLVSRINA